MAQQKRSQQYDWFKGAAANGGKKDPKEQAKKVWKFTKIFIYLALFVFSMTGCIQSLIIKTTNYVGTGVEFYANRDEVAPHVSRLDIAHTQGVTASGTTKAVQENYVLSAPASNIWLNKDIKTAGTQYASLADVHAAVADQSNAKGKGKLRLEDAFKGSNEALWISTTSSDFPGVTKVAGKSGDTPLVLSSLADTSAFKAYSASDADRLAGVKFYEVKDGKYTSKTFAAGSLKSFVSNQEYIDAKKAALAKADPTNAGNINAATSVADAFSAADATLPTVKAIQTSFDTDLAREAYSLAALKEVLSTPGLHEWLSSKAPTLTPAAAPSVEQKAAADSRMAFLSGLKDTFKLSINDAKDQTLGFHFTAGQYPFFGGKSNWRPLVTWGDAWGEGPFYGLFVYPTAYISANMIAAFPGGMAGWETLITIFVVVFSMRFLAFLLSFKATMQQTRMQELAAKKAIIDAKYAPYKGNKQMENRQRQEVSEMYKKQGVSPFGSMTSIFITMPLFLAIWRTIGALPHIKSTVWLGINFSATSWRELFHGSFQYLPLMILAAGFAAFQQILPRLLTKRRDRTRINVQQKAAMKKGNKTQNIMMLVFVFMSLIFSAGLQVYWIAGGIWMTIQSTLTHFLIIRQSKNNKRKKVKV